MYELRQKDVKRACTQRRRNRIELGHRRRKVPVTLAEPKECLPPTSTSPDRVGGADPVSLAAAHRNRSQRGGSYFLLSGLEIFT